MNGNKTEGFLDQSDLNKLQLLHKFNDLIYKSFKHKKPDDAKTTDLIYYSDPIENEYPFSYFDYSCFNINSKSEKIISLFSAYNKVTMFAKKDNIFLVNDHIFLTDCKANIDNYIKDLIAIFIKFCKQFINKFTSKSSYLFGVNMPFVEQDLNSNLSLYLEKGSCIFNILNKLKKSTQEIKVQKKLDYNKRKNWEILKEKILSLKSEKSYSVNEICEICNITRYRYYMILSAIKSNKNLSDSCLNNRIYKGILGTNEINFIKSLLDNKFESFSVPQIRDKLFEHFKIYVSKSLIYYHIRKTLRYSYKRTLFKDKSFMEPVQKIIEYKTTLEMLLDLKLDKNLVYLDETSLQISDYKEFSFSPVNVPSIKAIRRSNEKINILMAVNKNRILGYILTKTNIDKFIFIRIFNFLYICIF